MYVRKRRDQKKSPISIPVPILNLDEEEELVMKGTFPFIFLKLGYLCYKFSRLRIEKVEFFWCFGWKESEKKKTEPRIAVDEENKLGGDKLAKDNPDASCSNSALPCMDKLREELSCAVRVYIFLVLFSVLTLVDWNTQLCFLSSFFFLYYFFFSIGV